MKKRIYQKLLLFVFMIIMTTTFTHSSEVKKDEIIAVVNDQVILRSDVDEEIKKIEQSVLVKEFANLTEREILDKILEKMILDNLLIQATKRFGINISDIAVENALKQIAEKENVSLNQLRTNIINSGKNYQQYVEDLRTKIAVDELFRTQFYSRIRVSNDEIENFLKNEKLPGTAESEYDISELVILDESKSLDKFDIDKLSSDINTFGFEEAKNKYKNFNIEIKHHGKTKESGLPDIFVKALKGINTNSYTKVIESGIGYHILKLNNKEGAGQVFINEYKVYHILLTPDVMTTEKEIQEKLFELRNEIKSLDEFINFAKRYSEDKASGVKGGDLGWVRVNSLVKEFSDVMMKTPVKKISDPFKSRFGWHILYLENIRSIDDTDARMKKNAAHQIRIIKAQREREDWVAKLREQAYIEIKDF
ncbi:MAG: peptidylprolyl isomerase [Pseudomonadota bacterium]|nr:peptidylprolyl isomerase [Pseudomonadota bacterium]